MSRKTIITKVQRTADLKSTKLPAHEVSRVSRLVLDQVLAEMDRWDIRPESYSTCWTELRAFISRAKRKHERRGKR